MSQADLFAFVASALERLGLRWMVVGAHAASYHGRPRSTHDVDLLLELPPDRIDDLIAAFPTDRYYLSGVALREGRMANVIDLASGDKLDLFLRDTASTDTLAHRQPATIMGVDGYVASPEDTIVAKMVWNRELGGSERQQDDIRGMITVGGGSLDWRRLERRLANEGLIDDWNVLGIER